MSDLGLSDYVKRRFSDPGHARTTIVFVAPVMTVIVVILMSIGFLLTEYIDSLELPQCGAS